MPKQTNTYVTARFVEDIHTRLAEARQVSPYHEKDMLVNILTEAYDDGVRDGTEDGYDEGYQVGLQEGKEDA